MDRLLVLLISILSHHCFISVKWIWSDLSMPKTFWKTNKRRRFYKNDSINNCQDKYSLCLKETCFTISQVWFKYEKYLICIWCLHTFFFVYLIFFQEDILIFRYLGPLISQKVEKESNENPTMAIANNHLTSVYQSRFGPYWLPQRSS